MTSPAEFSVRQHIFVNLLFVLLMLGGLLMLGRIPVDFYPDISFNTALIKTEWMGAPAEDIERLVTAKIEDEIENVKGIKEIRSTSAADVSAIEVEWDETLADDEYESALADLRAALERVEDLPEAAEEPELRELSIAEVYASVMVAVVDEAGVGELALRAVARDLRDRIDDLPGVRRVLLRGARDRELRVLVDRNALVGLDLTLPEVSAIIGHNNRNIPAGAFTPSAGETTVRATGDFTTPEELAATIVKKSPSGSHVRLDEIARIAPGFEKQKVIGRYQRKPAVVLQVAKENDADLLDMVGHLKRFLDERRPYLPAGVGAVITLDTSSYVSRRLINLRDNLALGVAVVTGILWLTLGFRNALLAVIALPFSYLTAIFLFPMLDITINSLSIAGMILVSGMLVDDAIIVLENVYRHVEEGWPTAKAVVAGTNEVLRPVVASVTTTVAAFSPLLLISGTSGEFMSILPKTVILCLAASLLECLFTLPAHYVHFGGVGGRGGKIAAGGAAATIRQLSGNLRSAVDAGLGKVRRRYAALLEAVLRNRLAFGALLGGFAVFSAGLAWHLPVDLFAGQYNAFFVSLYGPTSYGLARTDQVMREIEAVLSEFGPEEVRDFSTYTGMAMNPDTIPIYGPHLGVAYVTLADTEANREHPDRVLRRVKQRVDAWWRANPTKARNVLTMPPRNGPPVGKPVAVQIRADDYALAKEIANQIKSFLTQLPGVYNVEDNLLPGPREMRVVMDEARASIHGLTFADVGLALRAANDGLVPSTFKDPAADEDVDIRVLFANRYRRNERDLLEAEIRTPRGYRVRLADVAGIKMARGHLYLGHHDTRRSVIVYADVVEGVATSESVNHVLQERFRDFDRHYAGVEIVYGGEFRATQKAFDDMFRVLPLAVLLIYVILAAQFRSYLQPLIVMMAIPFGVMGVTLGLFIFGYPLSFAIMYAVVGLSGVVVNDSLVLVTFINSARVRGAPLRAAVVDAGQKRFRQVLLTTLTTVGALLPTALGVFGRSIGFGPFAAAFAAGLTLATVFTLLFVPAGYYTLARLLDGGYEETTDATGPARSSLHSPVAPGPETP